METIIKIAFGILLLLAVTLMIRSVSAMTKMSDNESRPQAPVTYVYIPVIGQ